MRANFQAIVLGVCCAAALVGANGGPSLANTPPASDVTPLKSQSAQPAPAVSQPQQQHEVVCTEPKKTCEAPKISACQNGGWVCIGPDRPD